MEDIFITRLYSSGVLRYAENDSDMDSSLRWKFTAKGPNSLGNNDGRRIPIRQRILHPSMLGTIDIADTSSSDPREPIKKLIRYIQFTVNWIIDRLWDR